MIRFLLFKILFITTFILFSSTSYTASKELMFNELKCGEYSTKGKVIEKDNVLFLQIHPNLFGKEYRQTKNLKLIDQKNKLSFYKNLYVSLNISIEQESANNKNYKLIKVNRRLRPSDFIRPTPSFVAINSLDCK